MSKRLFLLFLLFFPIHSFAQLKTAIFAGGCFWCVESDFDKLDGVKSTVSGYDGGTIKAPDYQKVSSGKTQYAEAVKIKYDPAVVSYAQLLDYFFKHIDPTVKDRQFCDKGRQYRSAVFYLNDAQKRIAMAYKEKLKQRFTQVYTEVVPSTHFYPAETYHQNYYKKHPYKYKFYRYRCGRDSTVKKVWMENNKP